jgi:hypothetical protein
VGAQYIIVHTERMADGEFEALEEQMERFEATWGPTFAYETTAGDALIYRLLPGSEDLTYTFREADAPGLGWGPRSISVDGESYRRMIGWGATFDALYPGSGDALIRFRVLGDTPDSYIGGLTVYANDRLIPLTPRVDDQGGWVFAGRIPVPELENYGGVIRLRLTILAIPDDFSAPLPAFDWLRIVPAPPE